MRKIYGTKDLEIQKYDEIVKIGEAFSCVERVKILDILLESRPLTVGEVNDIVGAKMYNTSRHLKMLSQSGLTERSKISRSVYYSVKETMVMKIRVLFS